jgi:perosamine synthetase
MINYGLHSISITDVDAVVNALNGRWLTQGPLVTKFEENFASFVGAEHAVAFSSGTAALHAAAAAAGFDNSDTVYTSPLTFIASANCIRYVGAQVGLVDISEETFNMQLANLPPEKSGIVAVHFAGLPLDLSVVDRTGMVIIEDAAHALGAETPRGRIGNCSDSDMCCFSFHPVKAITTGEGGMVTTNSEMFAERLRKFGSHGIEGRGEAAPWHYDVKTLGYNYRLTDIQAALGISQLSQLESFIQARNEIAARYRSELDSDKYQLPPAAPIGYRHAYHLFAIRTKSRLRVYQELKKHGVNAQVHYVPVHHHSISKNRSFSNHLPVCDSVYEEILSLPIYPLLTAEEQTRVIRILNDMDLKV